jgi:hypothetical protein
VDVTVSPDLAQSLRAAALDRANIHNDLCTVFDPDDQRVCTCGVPRLLADLAALLLSASPADARVR